MNSKVLYIALACICLWPVSVIAQERDVPGSKAEITLSFAPLVKQVAPAVVNIYTKRTVTRRATNPFFDDPFFAPFFRDDMFGGRMRRQVESSLGSGVILDPAGLVITNAHVIQNAEEITVALNDGREFEASLSLIDAPSDLALLRLSDAPDDLPHATIRPSENLQVGDLVLAIGNPFGVGQTVTSGIVSALARSSLNINDFNFFIQTDAAINPGNSGGALVSLDGGVVGINTAIFSRDGGSLGIGFAIPSEMVASLLTAEKMGRSGTDGVIRPWLGVEAQNVTSDIAKSLDLDKPQGVLISHLHSASPLRESGVKVGDIITSFNGRPLRDPAEMKFRIATVPIGETTDIEVIRKGETLSFEIEAIAPPEDPPRNETVLEGRHPLYGATIANINPAVSAELGIGAEAGVVLMAIPKSSYGHRVLAEGDLLLEINGREISSVEDVESALSNPTQRGWLITVESQGRKRQIILR